VRLPGGGGKRKKQPHEKKWSADRGHKGGGVYGAGERIVSGPWVDQSARGIENQRGVMKAWQWHSTRAWGQAREERKKLYVRGCKTYSRRICSKDRGKQDELEKK